MSYLRFTNIAFTESATVMTMFSFDERIGYRSPENKSRASATALPTQINYIPIGSAV